MAQSNIKIVFTDRDGVLNLNRTGKYVLGPRDLRLLPGVKEAVAQLTRSSYEIHLISNQQGVAKGLMTQEDLYAITDTLQKRLEKFGGKLTSLNYCLHLEADQCKCRKPQSGLFHQAVQGRSIDFSQTWMIGDTWRDMEAGKKTGCKTILVQNKEYSIIRGTDSYTDGNHSCTPDYAVSSFLQAVKLILQQDKSRKTK